MSLPFNVSPFTLVLAVTTLCVPTCHAASAGSPTISSTDRVAPSPARRTEASSSGLTRNDVALIAACATSGTLIIICIIVLLWFWRRRWRIIEPRGEGSEKLMRPSLSAEGASARQPTALHPRNRAGQLGAIGTRMVPDDVSAVERGPYGYTRPLKLISTSGPPPRGLLAASSTQSSPQLHSADELPSREQVHVPSQPAQSAPLVLDFNPYRDSSSNHPMSWTVTDEGAPRVKFTPEHPLPSTSPVISSPIPVRAHAHSNSWQFDNSHARPVVAPQTQVQPSNSRAVHPSLLDALAIQPPSESPSPTVPLASPASSAATPAAMIQSAVTPHWPRFGFLSGVPDEYGESPHTATTNATAYDWRRSMPAVSGLGPRRQPTLSREKSISMARSRSTRRQRTMSQPGSAVSTAYASHGHDSVEDVEVVPRVPSLFSAPIPVVPFKLPVLQVTPEESSMQMDSNSTPSMPAPPPPTPVKARAAHPPLRVNTTLRPAPAVLAERPARRSGLREPSGPRVRPSSAAVPRLRGSFAGPLIVQNNTST